MFKIRKKIIINQASQMQVLEANPVAGSAPVIGEGTSKDDFDGFVGGNYVSIVPLAAQFTLAQLRSIRKTVVAANSNLLSDINFATPVAGTNQDLAVNRIAQSTTVRRESGQTSTLVINAVPPVGSLCEVQIWQREVGRNDIESQRGEKRFVINLQVNATHTTTALFAAYIAAKIEETLEGRFNQNFRTTITVSGSTITLVSRTGYYFGVSTVSGATNVGLVDINTTFATTIPAWQGVNNYKWMRRHIQNNDGWYNLNTGETDFFPIDGVYYTSYYIEYETTSDQEHQQGTIDAVQTHRHELQIFVNPTLTNLITKLDLIGGF